MSELQASLTKYIAGFRRKLESCKTRDECAVLWRQEQAAREALCIVPLSYSYNELQAEWIARGRELAGKEKAA